MSQLNVGDFVLSVDEYAKVRDTSLLLYSFCKGNNIKLIMIW